MSATSNRRWAAVLAAFALVAFGAAGAACGRRQARGSGDAPDPADLQALTRLRDAYVAANNDGDVDRLVALFADDAVFVPEDDATCEGKDAIADYFDDVMKEEPSTLEFEVKESRVDGDWAFERIDATVYAADAESGEDVQTWARYFWVLRRQPDGGWKIARAIYNIEEPGDEDDDGDTLRHA